ncbi:MAG TPA: 16S rRNA (adenine(1518)-N(6)/adenine(1519)-N(6))-dimethyltransferase RsmA [Bacteroidales bacterium]|nr:16S rRNA (adenine(1518)-N(6)/adenine(1519)-N(6))-dimethyltransferase RsmA [Bacteroidales bacterium]
MNTVKAKKSFGQHFLKSNDVAQKIADYALTHTCTKFLEIGPGMGMLTQFFIDKPIDFKVIEVDNDSVDYLLSHEIVKPHMCIHADFLRISVPDIFSRSQYCIVGNFPYNISSQIVFKMIEHREFIPGMTGMFQREVARRICSPKGSKEYGILSVLVQAFYTTEYHFTLDEHEFIPPPKVKSGVISLFRKQDFTLPCDEKQFFEVVKTGFNQRRKTLNNSLKKLLGDAKLPIDIGLKRPEQLGVEEFIELTNYIAQLRNK